MARHSHAFGVVRIVLLADNAAGPRGLLAEHGLSLWLEAGGCRILFDTGQGLALGHNAEALGIPLARADAVVLSHGHYDHTGGLALLLLQGRRHLPVYAHPEAMSTRYVRRDGEAREIGMPDEARQALARWGAFRSSRASLTVCGGVHLTGAIPRLTDFEEETGAFFLDGECREPDPLVDDQAAFVETRAGTVVLLGCAHAGVVNTLVRVESLTKGTVHAVIGGMHLAGAGPERIAATVRALVDRDTRRVVPCHCTGLPATAALVRELGDRCTPGHAGLVLEFED
jgi:7,8-dihydropterin-6-yl-methyl-4-(beta-D-ribofuranosyl)aminobenzene 5'-phosphate synthase